MTVHKTNPLFALYILNTFISLIRLSSRPMAFSISPGDPWKLPMPKGSSSRSAGGCGGAWQGGGGEKGSAPNRSFPLSGEEGVGRGGGAEENVSGRYRSDSDGKYLKQGAMV